MSRRLLIILLAALCALGACLGLGACGGTSPSPAAAKASAQEKMLKFARCMREHGVNMPDPVAGQPMHFSTANPQGIDAAQNACKRYSAATEISPAEKASHLAAGLKFARCMRQHGIDVPDPTTSGSSVQIKGQAGPGSINPSSPTFQAAQNACQGLLGKNLPKMSVQSSRPSGGPASGATGTFSGPSGG
jgi:hypothetical protein